MTDDTISREAAIEAATKFRVTPGGEIFEAIRRAVRNELEALPSAGPERKKGRWVDIDAETYTWKIRCDQCGHERSMLSTGQMYPRFCENCGADMRGDSHG